MKKMIIILPAFNESEVIGSVIKSIHKILPALKMEITVMVVNDGSTDRTAQKARDAGAKVLTHRLNRGLGASLGTGLEFAKRSGVDLAVTMDSDGQHDPDDIARLIGPIIKRQADVVIGSRMMTNKSTMPKERQLINRLSNWLTRILFGVKTTDSLSGFRAFNRRAIAKIEIRTERMEASNEFFQQIHSHRLRLAEVPIQVIYTKYSLKKGQKPGNAVAILFRLLLRLFR
jgi:glycosyltransferase involved in cell wall biosynthesis